jgi:hypothetical protein
VDPSKALGVQHAVSLVAVDVHFDYVPNLTVVRPRPTNYTAGGRRLLWPM